MAWEKPTEQTIALFDSVVPRHAKVERRKMFGFPVAFANGHMFIGLHENRMILRLGEAERERFIAAFAARVFEPMPGRPMREYVVVPDVLLGDRAELQSWCDRALDYALSLPAKKAAAGVRPAKKSGKRAAANAKRTDASTRRAR
jgi:TfoX/Sxy family transcriptional regulator of competence genes